MSSTARHETPARAGSAPELLAGTTLPNTALFSSCGIFPRWHICFVKLIEIYQCLCDETRLRILHLLARTPLCVCHFQSVLNEPQVKISKHLNYLRKHGMVEVRQHRNWRIYRLPEKRSFELTRHLQCLQDCVQEKKLFRDDLRRLKAVTRDASSILQECAAPASEANCCD